MLFKSSALEEHVQSDKAYKMHGVNSNGDEPDSLSDDSKYRYFVSVAELKIKTAEYHHAHSECSVKTARNDLAVLIHHGLREHDNFQNVANDEDRSACHTQIAEPDKSETAVDVAESQQR